MTRERHEVLQTVAMIVAIFMVMIGAAFAADMVEANPQPQPQLSFALGVDIEEQSEMEHDLLVYTISITNRGPKAVRGLNFWGHLPQQTLELVDGDFPWFGSTEPAVILPAGQEGAKRQWTITLPVKKIGSLNPSQLRIMQDPDSILLMVEAEGLPPTPHYFE